MIKRITPIVKEDKPDISLINEQQIHNDFPNLFSNKTGKCTAGGPIPIQLKDPSQVQINVPRYRRVPLHYAEKYKAEVKQSKSKSKSFSLPH